MKIKQILPVLIGIIAVVAVVVLWITSLFPTSDEDRNTFNFDQISRNTHAENLGDYHDDEDNDEFIHFTGDGEEIFHVVYNSDVKVMANVPSYSIVEESEGIYIVTILNPTNQLRQLLNGDKIVLEPTAQNPNGLAGYIINIVSDDGLLVKTVRVPNTLEEIFDEFEFVGDIDLLSKAEHISISSDLLGLQGVEIGRNPTQRLWVNLNTVPVRGMTLNGRVELIAPRFNASLNRNQVNHLIVTTGVLVNITATYDDRFDRLIDLFTIPVSLPYGIHIDVPVGILISAHGKASVTFNGNVNAQFGYRDGKEHTHITISHNHNGSFEASLELSVNIQARASVMMIPIYGVEGTFGKGIRTDSQMQQLCMENCFVVGLYHVRNIRSADWGLFRWIPLNWSFGDRSSITGFRYIHNGRWNNSCPHREQTDTSVIQNTPESSTPGRDTPSPDLPSITSPGFGLSPGTQSGFNPFGTPVTLVEAQRTPGVYMKSGDLFILIRPQWRTVPSGYSGYHSISDVGNAFFGSAAEKTAILFNQDFQVPKIYSNAQLVLIGVTNADIFEPFDTGWTIPHIVSLGVHSRHWIDTGHEYRELVNYARGSFGNIDQRFETINNNNPLDYVDRMLYTRESWLLLRFQGLLTGTQGEEFTFGWWETTNLIERTYVADRRFFTVMGPDFRESHPIPNYFIVVTEKGYFEIEFIEPPIGFYSIRSGGQGSSIVEFVSP
jgi:hypothetical protein